MVSQTTSAIIWLILTIIAIYLAVKQNSGDQAAKTQNIYFAVLVPPVYIVSYLISMFTG